MGKYNLEDVTLEDLRKEFEPIDGYLVVPDKEGKRKPTKFVGILREVFKYTDNRKKQRYAAVFESVADQDCVAWDKEDAKEFKVLEGMRIGVSISGAISNIIPNKELDKAKINHLFHLEFTGELQQTDNGKMLVVNAKVSEKPVKEIEEEPKKSSKKTAA